MPTPSTVILGTGSYVPARTVTNAELSKQLDTSEEWISSRSGIRQRHIAAPEEATSDMGVAAARKALQAAGTSVASIDLLIVATLTPDLIMPSTACIVGQKLGLPDTAACFDINAACAGFIYALDTASALIGSGRYRQALIIGVEKMSSVVDWKDRSTAVLFGDGAGAVVVAAHPESDRGVLRTRLGTVADSIELLRTTTGPGRPEGSKPAGRPVIQMKGREVYKVAVRVMEAAARDILEQQGLTANQIALVIPHQANLRIIESLAHFLKLPLDRFFVNVDRYGNTSAASIPIALDEARQAGRIKPGDINLLIAFGAGLTYGSALIRW